MPNNNPRKLPISKNIPAINIETPITDQNWARLLV